MESNDIVKGIFNEVEKTIDAVQKAISNKGKYMILADIADTESKTAVNKWDGKKIISQFEI